jgi:signal transduction histidine kinase
MRACKEANWAEPKGKHRVGSGSQALIAVGETGRERQEESVGSFESVIAGVGQERSRAGETLQDLTGKLLQAQEEERRRIARELHDGLNQQLAMLAVELGLLAQQVPSDLAAVQQQLLELRSRTEALSNDLRLMTHRLHPAILEHLGLVSALRSHCSEFSQQEGVQTWLEVESAVGSVPAEVAICLFRITQEALRNVAKHSGAREAWVKLSMNSQQICLSIRDQGSGFNTRQANGKAGLGLISIRERVQSLRGDLSVAAKPNGGTRIEVLIPVTWKDSQHEHEKEQAQTKAAVSR